MTSPLQGRLWANGKTDCVIALGICGQVVDVDFYFIQCGYKLRVCLFCSHIRLLSSANTRPLPLHSVAQKTGYCSFSSVFVSYVIIYIIALIISIISGSPVVFFLIIIPAWIFSIFLRFHVVSRYQIVNYGGFTECLVAFFCCSCSVCQSKLRALVQLPHVFDYLYCCFCAVARHVYGYRKVFDGDSDPDKKDYYTV